MRSRDEEVLTAITEARGGFGHREHLELAWTYLQMYDVSQASEAMAAAIRHLARRHGAEQKYHETLTRAWVRCVAVHRQRWAAEDFDAFLERNPDLLERGLIKHFYSRDPLDSERARAAWADPDLRALPALP
jgi:hypothetical protein